MEKLRDEGSSALREPMDIVFFGQQNWDFCWVTKQHLLTRLARRGHRVLYIQPDWEQVTGPLDVRRTLKGLRAGFGLREVAPDLFVYSVPYVPAFGWRWNYRRFPRAVARVARKLGFCSPVAVANLPQRSVELVNAVRPSARVYFVEDEWTAFGEVNEARASQLRCDEDALLREVDLALAISPRLVRRLSLVQPRVHLLENAADVEHFSPQRLEQAEPHPLIARLPYPRLGFMGQIDERLDQDLLVALARRRPDWHIVLAGRVKRRVDIAALQSEPNIHLVGYHPYEELPSVVCGFDVCLVPYRLTELTQSCWPLKAMEYLATGRPIVATPLESLMPLRDQIRIAPTHDEFIAAAEAALLDPEAGRDNRLALAAQNSWEHRTSELESRLQEALEVARRRSGGDFRAAAANGARRNPKFEILRATSRASGRLYHAARRVRRWSRGERPTSVQRILIARHGWLGDTIAILPLLAAIRRRYPQAWIVLGVQPGFSAGPIVEASGAVDEIRELPQLTPDSSRGDDLASAWRLFSEGFDLVFSGARFALQRAAFLSGAPRFIGLDDGHPLHRLNDSRVLYDHGRHEVENNLALVELLRAEIPFEERIPRVPLDPAAVRSGWEELASVAHLPADAPILTLHAGSAKPSRRWPAERFAALAEQLLRSHSHLHVALTGSRAEAALVDSIRAALPWDLQARTHDCAGLTTLTSLVGLLDRSAALVCNDTGIMHLARARGTPLVTIFGPENDWKWGPYPAGAAPAVVVRREVPCAPCRRNDCDRLYCMRSVAVADVIPEVEGLLNAWESGRASHTGVSAERAASASQASQLFPVVRRIRRLEWADLASAGYQLPLVSVVAAVKNPSEVQSIASTLDEQDYPKFELVAVSSCSGTEASRVELTTSEARIPCRVVGAAELRDTGLAFREALRGELVIGWDSSFTRDREYLSRAVARWLREGRPFSEAVRISRSNSDNLFGIPRGAMVPIEVLRSDASECLDRSE